jgi:L-lactate dehydrogenase complex protein LldE
MPLPLWASTFQFGTHDYGTSPDIVRVLGAASMPGKAVVFGTEPVELEEGYRKPRGHPGGGYALRLVGAVGPEGGDVLNVDRSVPAAYPRRVRVALFITCFNDTLFPATGRAVVELLERLGVEVEFPEAQTCCGQWHTNSGYADDGDALVERFKRVFADCETVVSPSASCVAHLRGHAVEGVFELTEFLIDVLGVEDVGAIYPHRVAYHSTCHSLRLLKIGDRPLRLLRAVQGLDLVELEGARECCGFGGVFAVKNADTSMAMLSDKLRHVLDTRAEICTSADNSCLMSIGGALRRQRTGVRTVHIAEILAATG